MFATATTHLPLPCGEVVDLVLGRLDPSRWLPQLHRVDDRRLDELGARSILTGPDPAHGAVELTTTRVVRSTVTLTGTSADGRTVALCLSLSPWDGGTAVVVTLDDGGPERTLLAWGATRRLGAALVRLAALVAAGLAPAGRAHP